MRSSDWASMSRRERDDSFRKWNKASCLISKTRERVFQGGKGCGDFKGLSGVEVKGRKNSTPLTRPGGKTNPGKRRSTWGGTSAEKASKKRLMSVSAAKATRGLRKEKRIWETLCRN